MRLEAPLTEAVPIVLADHIGISHEGQPDLPAEAEQVLNPKRPKAVRGKPKGSAEGKSATAKPEKKQASKKKAA
jgi:hypothetical protein